ncbi:MAG: type I 3-dehydroquinate dehydratase, partial [Myxococcota bacterium]|nr:type I 3-dehydroquinate dehydratase [Myxococcota bacterium]
MDKNLGEQAKCPMDKKMLCLTGRESTLLQLEHRLGVQTVDAERVMHEVRMEFLPEPLRASSAFYTLLARFGARIVLSCRRPQHLRAELGGEPPESAMLEEQQRLELLRLAARRVRWVDLEDDVDDEHLKAIGERTSVLLSYHDFEYNPMAQHLSRLAQMRRRPAGMVKMAVRVDTPQDLLQLLQIAEHEKPAVLIGMGPAGSLSRYRYRHFSSPWTYVAFDGAARTAPGQLSLDEARAQHLPHAAKSPCYALIGAAQADGAPAPALVASPGERVYPKLFARCGRRASYLSIPCADFDSSMQLLAALGVAGASVTMPHKANAFKWIDEQGGVLDSSAQGVGAVNTLYFDGIQWRGENSDILGIQRPLAQALASISAQGPHRVLVLGS